MENLCTKKWYNSEWANGLRLKRENPGPGMYWYGKCTVGSRQVRATSSMARTTQRPTRVDSQWHHLTSFSSQKRGNMSFKKYKTHPVESLAVLLCSAKRSATPRGVLYAPSKVVCPPCPTYNGEHRSASTCGAIRCYPPLSLSLPLSLSRCYPPLRSHTLCALCPDPNRSRSRWVALDSTRVKPFRSKCDLLASCAPHGVSCACRPLRLSNLLFIFIFILLLILFDFLWIFVILCAPMTRPPNAPLTVLRSAVFPLAARSRPWGEGADSPAFNPNW